MKRPHVDENEAQAALAKRGQSMPKMSISLSRATKLGTTARNTLNLQNKPLERKPEILKKVLPSIQFGGNKTLVSVDLATDIDEYLRVAEEEHKIRQNFLSEKQVDWRMRQILVDWLFRVRLQFELQPETLSLAVYLLDKTLLRWNGINKRNLQLYGITCVFTAAKYEEMILPHIDDCILMAANAYSRQEIFAAELKILKITNFELNRPHTIQFLRRFRCLTRAIDIVYILSRYFCDVSLLVYELVHVKLSTIAASSLYLAFIVYNMPPPSDKFLSDNLLVDAPNVKAVARALVNPALHFLERDEKLTALKEEWKSTIGMTNVQIMRMKHFLRSKAH